MILSDANSAFQAAAGVAPGDLSLAIRTILLVLGCVWAGWIVLGLISHIRHHEADIEVVMSKSLRIAFILSLLVVLVYI